MKNLKTKKLNSETTAIIDIWSYKVRVAICEFSDSSIKLLSFAEKRQSAFDIVNNQIKNLEWVCETIKIAIKKAEEKALLKVDNFAINPIFWDTFFYSKKISYKRENPFKLIDEIELKNIIKKTEEIHFLSATKQIYENYLYPVSDLEIIISNISEIKIDWKVTKELLQNTWRLINLNILNVFLNKNNIELLNYISKYLKKDLKKILPEEFCLSKIWEKKKEVVIIDIWNSNSYITVKDANSNIFGTVKIWVWIESLVKKIASKSKFSRIEIIKKINREDFYPEEKKEFLEIFVFLIAQGLQEIMWEIPTPNNFFVIWGWWNNSFVKKFIENYDFSKYIKIDKKIKFLIPNVKKIWKIENVEKILNKSNLNLISMILTYNDILKHKKNKIEIILKDVIKEIIKEK